MLTYEVLLWYMVALVHCIGLVLLGTQLKITQQYIALAPGVRFGLSVQPTIPNATKVACARPSKRVLPANPFCHTTTFVHVSISFIVVLGSTGTSSSNWKDVLWFYQGQWAQGHGLL